MIQERLIPKVLNLSWDSIKRLLDRWHFWVLVPCNLLWLMGYESNITGSPTLWLESDDNYSVFSLDNFKVGVKYRNTWWRVTDSIL